MIAINNIFMKCKRKKILFINGQLNVGGIEKSLVDLLNWIDYSQYDINLLLLEGMGGYVESLPVMGNKSDNGGKICFSFLGNEKG